MNSGGEMHTIDTRTQVYSDPSIDGIHGNWWACFEGMLTDEQMEELGISEDRGAAVCITRLATAYNDLIDGESFPKPGKSK